MLVPDAFPRDGPRYPGGGGPGCPILGAPINNIKEASKYRCFIKVIVRRMKVILRIISNVIIYLTLKYLEVLPESFVSQKVLEV